MCRFSRDRGACGYDNSSVIGDYTESLAVAAKAIKLSQFCYSDARPFSNVQMGGFRTCFGALQQWLFRCSCILDAHLLRMRGSGDETGSALCKMQQLTGAVCVLPPQKDVCVQAHTVTGAEAAEYYTPERLAATGPFPLGKRDTLLWFNGAH